MPRAFLVKRFGGPKEQDEKATDENHNEESSKHEKLPHSGHHQSEPSLDEFYASGFKLRNDVRVLPQNRCVGKFLSNPYFEDFVVASRGISGHRMFDMENYRFLDFNKKLIMSGCNTAAPLNGVADNRREFGNARDSTDDSMDESGDYDWCDEGYDDNNNSSNNNNNNSNNNDESSINSNNKGRYGSSSNNIHRYNSSDRRKDEEMEDEDSDECDSVFVAKRAHNALLHQHHHEGGHDKLKFGGKPQFQCTQCDKTFKTKYTLNIHRKMPSHTTLKPFVCPTCGKGFRLSSTLCRHKIIHTSQRPHRCHVCQKSFNRSSTLKTHLRTHSNVKEFTCTICGKGFHQKGNLRNHVLIHTGEKPYECSVCKKSFNKLSNLKFHMHSHTDQKPYRCRYCKQSFAKRGELKQHIPHCKRESSKD